ncbi:MAG: HEAT repeat domain-containing protein [Gemmatimonadota bacterium]|nr:HEAT repeat domain-containing protein [Gemmatimonadota bacterium]
MTNPLSQLAPKETSTAPFEHDRVEELLRLFGKAARTHQLYLPNNPVYKTAHDALRAGFAPIWAQTDEIALSFSEHEVKWEGETVLEEQSRGSDSLPWIFYKDGVRELRMLRGFETDEIDRLLDILQRVRKASPDEDDLLTLLWEGDFNYLRYRYVDLSQEATVPLADGGEATAASDESPREAIAAAAQDTAANNAVVNMADFDGTLYFLDEKEIEYLQSEVRREYQTDLRQNVVSVLLDIFETQQSAPVRDEIAEILDGLMLHMLSAGQFQNVAFLVRESLTAVARAPELQQAQRDRLSELPSRLSSPDALSQLLQSLDESPELPQAADVLELFEQLRGPALGTVLDWLGRLQNVRLRPMLEQAASRLASQNTGELVKLIQSTTPHVALEAVRRAGALQTQAAVAPLARVLADGAAELRLAAVLALNEIGSPGALQALERGVDDTEREIRVATLRAIQARAYRPALPRLEAAAKGKAAREADLSEKMALFEAFGTLCGDGGVPFLDGMLNGKSMFGRREEPEMRACAAIALGRVKGAAANAALQKAAVEKDVIVRNAVGRALRGSA